MSSYAWIWDAFEDCWSHQRRQRREKKRQQTPDEDLQPPAEKRFRSDPESKLKICRLQARLDEDQGVCQLFLLFVDGTNSDAANQIGQFIKNDIENYFQNEMEK